MSADRDREVADIVFDMDDDITNLQTAIAAVRVLTSIAGNAGNDCAVPYSVAVLVVRQFSEYEVKLRERWERLFKLTAEPRKIARLEPRRV